MSHASVLLGNSSMGVLEAPLINLPVVNVGMRQKDRQMLVILYLLNMIGIK